MFHRKGLHCLMSGVFLGLLLMNSSCAKVEDSQVQALNDNKQYQDQLDAKLIYGDDNRLENYQASQALQSLAASTVALVKSSSLVKNAQGQLVLSGSQFGVAQRLCASEPFREQTAGAFCSGSLVGPDILITAGHCITNISDCSNTRFVFGFALKSAGNENKTFASEDVYGCQEIIRRDQQAAGADYAIIRLDRKVVGRSPLPFRKQGTVKVGDSLVVIGHPSGLPQKIAGGGQVRSIQSGFFVTNLDTYGGNSGSAVLDSTTGQVEGILVRGDTDFVAQGSCYVSNRCTDTGCRGEDVTRMDVLAQFIPGDESGSQPGASDEIFSSNTKLPIPDAPQAGVSSFVSVPTVPQGRVVRVKIDITHTYRGDLLVELLSPDGKVTVLHRQSGGSLDDLRGTYGGDLTSAQSLASLSQVSKPGLWGLRITDKARRDVGVLNSWSLAFSAGLVSTGK